jgi:hypothetical protein
VVSFTPEQEAIAIEVVMSVWWNRDWRTEAKRAIADALSFDADAAASFIAVTTESAKGSLSGSKRTVLEVRGFRIPGQT